jgi:hypothetical protein
MATYKTIPRGPSPAYDLAPSLISLKIAAALIGRTVDVLTQANNIAHGIVSGVLTQAGRPKVVVLGRPYDLNQVLTATPTAFN